ncbi:hypothetical protein IWQ57_003536 [Coemansia nantahalensis]|uniref:Uncharacterized protein n=1 Tax=Coemansia nantahalensis TaxID=2789366 RepID=A0ACC1JW97_9FUNG|nr:hypothetical protein IWQ57_003536 [Coemansia nantahalensis]
MMRPSSASSSAEAVNGLAPEPPVKRVSSLSRSPGYGSTAPSHVQHTPGPMSPRTPGPASPWTPGATSPRTFVPGSPAVTMPASPQTPRLANLRAFSMTAEPAGRPPFPLRFDSAPAAASSSAGRFSADAAPAPWTQQQQQIECEAGGPARKRRDRSMTLPSISRAPRLLRPSRRSPRKATAPSSPANAELERLAKGIAIRSAAAATAVTEPERLTLDIRGSPLLEPATQGSLGHSAGLRIQRQAVRNLSTATEEEAELCEALMLLPLLPSPARTTATDRNQPHSPRPLETALGGPPAMQLEAAAPGLGSPAATTADGRNTDAGSGASSEVAIDTVYTSVVMGEDKLRLYLRQTSGGSASGSCGGSSSAELVPLNDSGVRVNDRRTARSGSKSYLPRRLAGSASQSTSDINRHAGAGGYSASLLGLGASASRSSLPIAEARATSPLCPFSFSHSRFSLINQDGSLNMANYQFEQLEGYQRHLSASGSSTGSQPLRSEGSLAEGRARKNTDADAASSGGWFWGMVDPPGALGSSGSGGSGPGQAARQRRLLRRPRKQTATGPAQQCVPEAGLGAGLPRLPPPPSLSVNLWTAGTGGYPRASASFSGVPDRSFSASSVRSVPVAGPPGATGSRISESSASRLLGAGDRGSWRRRPSQQQELSIYPMPAVPMFRRRGSDNPAARVPSGGRWPRLMQMAPESVPFDVVYQSTAASMSLEEALTLVEGMGQRGASMASLASSLAVQRSRRPHRRASSVLTLGELDDVMIRTAEVCHSVQAAIRVQQASESGLGDWIASVLIKQQEQLQLQHQEQLPQPAEELQSPEGRASDQARFFSADCSPDAGHEAHSASSGDLSACAAAVAAGQSRWAADAAVPSPEAAGGHASSEFCTDCGSQESVPAHDPVAAVTAAAAVPAGSRAHEPMPL